MCGRYILEDDKKQIYKRYKVLESDRSKEHLTKPQYNIAPGFVVPVVTKNSPNMLEPMKWGLIPFWAKDPRIGYKLINAREDSVSIKPSFKESFKKRRCLIPATGFYEWQKSENSKVKMPFLFRLKSHELFSLAGIYDIWKDAEGMEIKTFTIITTDPNSLMEPVHNRMPVMLSQNEEAVWLNNDSPIEGLLTLLDPFPSDEMESYTVSQKVNSPKNQGKELLEKFSY